MSTLFQRLRGGDESVDKIPIWPVLFAFSRLLTGQTTTEDIIAEFDLSEADQVIFMSICEAVTAKTQVHITEFMRVGHTAEYAALQARLLIWNSYWQLLVGVETGMVSEQEFYMAVGIDV